MRRRPAKPTYQYDRTADGYAILPARLVQYEGDQSNPPSWNWVIDPCPACGYRHSHGGIPLDQDPREQLGHRAAHCLSGPLSGYVLVEAGEEGGRDA